MAQIFKRLTTRAIAAKKDSGRYADGGGLYLRVTKSGAKSWIFIWRAPSAIGLSVGNRQKTSNRRYMGLGSINAVTLERAREIAAECRAMVADGRDPIEERNKARIGAGSSIPTFGQCADEYLEAKRPEFRNDKHAAQWAMTLTKYCDSIRSKPISEISTQEVIGVLTPHWQRVPETASRLRGRIEAVLDAAKAKGLRDGENPARWRGHLDKLLPKRDKLARGHFDALPYAELPEFIAVLRSRDGIACLLLEFTILTACRSHMSRLATWSEIDLEARVWALSPERMKAKRGYRVPLTTRTVEILKFMARISNSAIPESFVFPGVKRNRPLSDMSTGAVLKRMTGENGAAGTWTGITTHGFRSTFRDWCGEETSFSRELAETALAHTIGDETERAYRRGDALEKRRTVMEAWERFCDPTPSQNVVEMNVKRSC